MENPGNLITSDHLLDIFKWAIPLLISCFALGKSMRDSRRNKLENSTRARQQFNAELRRWTNDSIGTLSDAIMLSRQIELDQARVENTISKLSALADQGRLLFPNPKLGVHGVENEEAYQDFRPRILDWLIYGLRICGTIRVVPDTEASRSLVQLKRGFTSDAQMAIDPRNLFTTMEDLQELLSTGAFMDNTQQHASLLAAETLLNERRRNVAQTNHKSGA
jgi:hypothetical protein